MPVPPHWTPCHSALQQVLERTEAAHRAALAAAASGQSDEFASCCALLTQALGSAQPSVAAMAAHKPVPAEVKRLLEAIDTRLQALQEFTTRQDAATRLALGVIFPADQLREYSRLGSRLGAYGAGTRPAGTGFLKA